MDAVCARVAKKILPFEREEPQADLQKVEIFSSHLLALAGMFCELSERLTNTLFPVPVGLCGAVGVMGRRKTGFGWETERPLGIVGAEEDMPTGGSRLKVGVWLRCGLKGDVARNISW